MKRAALACGPGYDSQQRNLFRRNVFGDADTERHAADHLDFFHDDLLDLFEYLEVLHQVIFSGFAALADELSVIGDPGTLLLENLVFDAEVEDGARTRNALGVHDIEFALRKGRGDLVFHDLHLGAITDDFAGRFLDLTDTTDVDTDGGEEFEGTATGGGFGATEHHADLFANLIGKDTDAIGAADGGGQAAHRLAHHPSLNANGGVAHLAVELLLGDQGGDGIDDDDVYGTRTDECFDDIEGVFARFRLGDQEIIEIDADHL